MRTTLKLLLSCLIIYILVQIPACASRGRPGGGPVDKIPPEIIFTSPQPDTTGIADLNKIEINFSERMSEGSVENSIFISPPLNYEVDWSGGEELTLELTEDLQSDRTYVITIGSGAKDSHQNRMRESFQFAFSTGAELERGKVSGNVYGIKPEDVFYLYAYEIDNPDSLNPMINKADFLSQAGEGGEFQLNYLPLSPFRIFVVEDQNKNLLLDANFERVGIPFRDVQLDSLNSEVANLNFKITKMDTVPPMMTSARGIDKSKILIRFSEPVIQPDEIRIIDTLTNAELDVIGHATNQENTSQIFLYSAMQDSGNGYQIIINGLSDSLGNRFDEMQAVDFSGSGTVDTTQFELLKISPRDSTQNIKYPQSVHLQFSLPVDTASLYKTFLCYKDAGDTLAGSWQSKELRDFYYTPYSKFLPGKQYHFEFKMGDILSLFKHTLKDTLIHNTFFMISEDEFGSMSGSTSLNNELTKTAHINIIPVGSRSNPVNIRVNPDNTFVAEWLAAGEYKIGGFLDLDRNGSYSHGSLFPFTFSEPVFIGTDTIKVRKRWEFANIYVQFPEIE